MTNKSINIKEEILKECKHDYKAIPSNSLGVEVMCRKCGKRKKL